MTRILSPGALEFASVLPPGGFVVWGQGAAEPQELVSRLLSQRSLVGGFRAFVGFSLHDRLAEFEADDQVSFQSYIATGANARLHAAGRLDILPIHYSQIASSLPAPDLLLLSLARGPDGRLGYAIACEYLHDLVARAKIIIGEVNSNAPWTQAMAPFDESRLHAIVETDLPLPEAAPARLTAEAVRIGEHVAALVQDGATLQTGIGALPDAVLSALRGHRDLGVHTGAIGDKLVELIEAGVVTNAHKKVDTGISIAGILHGTAQGCKTLADHSDFRLAPTSYTHGAHHLAHQPRLTTINAAIEVDLSGQINSELADGRYIGGVGGAQEFNRAALRAEDGLPLILLPSTARKATVSRIVPRLSGAATIPRSDAGVIVTEHGVADLRGKSLSERRRLLLEIADPRFADELSHVSAHRSD